MSIEEQIDRAVWDWETSQDAMRWSPDLNDWSDQIARIFDVPPELLGTWVDETHIRTADHLRAAARMPGRVTITLDNSTGRYRSDLPMVPIRVSTPDEHAVAFERYRRNSPRTLEGEPQPEPCDVVCPEHHRHCAYAWPHEVHHCALDDDWHQEPLTPARVAQLRALGTVVVNVEGLT